MRTEIAEIREDFAEGQVGSSTMAHKRNPINFENLEGMWLRTKSEFGKVLDTLVSEHQRDLVGSSLMRDFPIILVNLVVQLTTLLRKDKSGVPFFSRIAVDENACSRNFAASANRILAEPIYIALQMAGYTGDAHELVNRKAVPVSQATGRDLNEVIGDLAREDAALHAAICRIPREQMELLHNPEHYTGNATEKALEIADAAASYVRGETF
jgi:adenylosuccinate lyase